MSKFKNLKLSIFSLYLDPDNPRFAKPVDWKGKSITHPDVQKDCMTMLKSNDLAPDKQTVNNHIKNLKNSIKQVGYLPINNIVVKEIDGEPDKYVVIEGNCRVCSIRDLILEVEEGKLTLKEETRKTLWTEENPNIIPVLLSTGTNDMNYEFQGIAHLIGKQDWKPYSQAKFLVNKMEQDDLSAKAAGALVGLSAAKSRLLVNNYHAYVQFETDDEYGDQAHTNHFNYFQEILKKPSLTSWLEWDSRDKIFKNKGRFKEFLRMFLGNDEHDQLFTMAIDVRKLPQIVEETSVYNQMMDEEITFQDAVDATDANPGEDDNKVIAKLKSLQNAAKKINTSLREKRGEELRQILEQIKESVENEIKIIDEL